jgi:hypothetical protein
MKGLRPGSKQGPSFGRQGSAYGRWPGLRASRSCPGTTPTCQVCLKGRPGWPVGGPLQIPGPSRQGWFTSYVHHSPPPASPWLAPRS